MTDQQVIPATRPIAGEAPLVGRSEEMRQLETALVRAAGGEGGAVILSGESGVGKTKLAQELMALARDRGFLVLQGRAYPLEVSLAYAPILDALGPFLRHLDPVKQARLIGGLADLGRLFADLRLPPAPSLGDPALEKTRLFEAAALLLERLSLEHPVVLFMDDLHWADQASVELLHYVARSLTGQRMLLITTYREDARDPARRVARLVMSLRRAGLCVEVRLGRLQAAAAAELTHHLLGAEPPAQLLALLDARAAGIPLFMKGLIRALLEGNWLVRTAGGFVLVKGAETTLPVDLRDLVLERLSLFDSAERHTLDLIAVFGEATPHSVLRFVSRLEGDRLQVSLNVLLESGLLSEERDGLDVYYRVTHPLVQEVIYAAISEMPRRQSHAAFAAALEELRPQSRASESSAHALGRLARHYSAAGPQVDRGRALETLLASGDRARDLFANDQAATYFAGALALIRAGNRVQLLPSTLEKLGEAWERVGEIAAAIVIWNEALSLNERDGNLAAIARLRRLLALAEWDRGGFEAAQAHLAAGLQCVAGQVDRECCADLLDAQVTVLSRLGDCVGVESTARELLAVAEEACSGRARVQAHLALAEVKIGRNDLIGAREEYLSALTIAEEAAEPLLVQRTHSRLIMIEFTLGDLERGRQHALLSLRLARNLGAPPLELYPLAFLALLDFLAGEWQAALKRSGEAVALARRTGVPRGIACAAGFHAVVLAWSGRIQEAEAHTADVQAVFGGAGSSDRPVRTLDCARAIVALQRGDYPRAQEIAASIALEGSDRVMLPFKLGILGEAQAAVGLADRAVATAEELKAIIPSTVSYAAAKGLFVEGLALAAIGQAQRALDSLTRAAEAFAGLGIPPEQARSRLEYARVASGVDRISAIEAAKESLALFEAMGGTRWADRARATLRNLGVRTTKRNQAPGGKALTPRELEVARLVAGGLTNAEVAKRLVLSQRTVTTHLEHIYARLGLSSRQSLIQYVSGRPSGLNGEKYVD